MVFVLRPHYLILYILAEFFLFQNCSPQLNFKSRSSNVSTPLPTSEVEIVEEGQGLESAFKNCRFESDAQLPQASVVGGACGGGHYGDSGFISDLELFDVAGTNGKRLLVHQECGYATYQAEAPSKSKIISNEFLGRFAGFGVCGDGVDSTIGSVSVSQDGQRLAVPFFHSCSPNPGVLFSSAIGNLGAFNIEGNSAGKGLDGIAEIIKVGSRYVAFLTAPAAGGRLSALDITDPIEINSMCQSTYDYQVAHFLAAPGIPKICNQYPATELTKTPTVMSHPVGIVRSHLSNFDQYLLYSNQSVTGGGNLVFIDGSHAERKDFDSTIHSTLVPITSFGFQAGVFVVSYAIEVHPLTKAIFIAAIGGVVQGQSLGPLSARVVVSTDKGKTFKKLGAGEAFTLDQRFQIGNYALTFLPASKDLLLIEHSTNQRGERKFSVLSMNQFNSNKTSVPHDIAPSAEYGIGESRIGPTLQGYVNGENIYLYSAARTGAYAYQLVCK